MLTCPRESEIRQLLERGQWPVAATPDLCAHVEGCRSCREMVLVTQAFRQARSSAMAAARPASSGVIWWRAQLRRRNAAVRRISRPLLGAQIFAFAIALAVAIGFIVWQTNQDAEWLTWLKQLPQSTSLQISSIWSGDPAGSGLVLLLLVSAVAVLALVGGVVVYLASEKQ